METSGCNQLDGKINKRISKEEVSEREWVNTIVKKHSEKTQRRNNFINILQERNLGKNERERPRREIIEGALEIAGCRSYQESRRKKRIGWSDKASPLKKITMKTKRYRFQYVSKAVFLSVVLLFFITSFILSNLQVFESNIQLVVNYCFFSCNKNLLTFRRIISLFY